MLSRGVILTFVNEFKYFVSFLVVECKRWNISLYYYFFKNINRNPYKMEVIYDLALKKKYLVNTDFLIIFNLTRVVG